MHDLLTASVIDYEDEIIKIFYYIVERDISGMHYPYHCSSCRRTLHHCTAAIENEEPCAVGIVPFKKHSFNYRDVCNSKRRNIYNFSST